MEKESSLELQDWQIEILNKEEEEFKWLLGGEIPITKAQEDMLTKVLGDDFFIGDEEVRETLRRVWYSKFYYEEDRGILNLARESYLKGKNWIKRNG